MTHMSLYLLTAFLALTTMLTNAVCGSGFGLAMSDMVLEM
eukprot:CAMPEP_0118711674 /NCGR_PEP_ID=MMETSP0800-20121206/24254_1 /TAXON_ID=210618 ORGANISM="Striatella unipunctata, Strain CCMP2910" /NCGR_SAMPLE_ID=MMETSP0800 /ASSEMBLY_ACC=CAM_ASM_000638 /LENGTH=39 /DNA_ID= /DNA_START= /DNA_END= /DNA_ORIENTATION=